MENIAAVICEYNPFHSGHKYQIDKIKEHSGSATVICIMSGNITQRGEFAFLDKYARAKAAALCGADAVFEMPFPYSASCAEIFAAAGVELCSKLGADTLYFGTEDKNISELEKIAECIIDSTFEEKVKLQLKSCTSYIEAKDKVLRENGFTMPTLPNDILALEYICAIKKYKHDIKYESVKRVGAGYKDESVCDIMSATAIRKHFYKEGEILSVPENAGEFYKELISGGAVLDEKKEKEFLFRYVLSQNTSSFDLSFDSGVGIGNFIHSVAVKSKTADDFFSSLASKSYTLSRLKRLITYSIFGITDVDKLPKYTVLLSANKKGREVAKKADITVITKMTDTKKLDPVSQKAFCKEMRIDEFYMSLLKEQKVAYEAYKMAPFIK